MKFNRLALSAVLSLGVGVAAQAGTLVLTAPAKSADGSYVLRVSSPESEINPSADQLEVYRNKDGGEYRRILVGPRFTALSELVRENGTYGYKVRWLSTPTQAREESFSKPVFVKVSTAVPRMVARRRDKLVSSIDPNAGVIN